MGADMTMSLLPRQETTALTRLATSERPPATTDPQTPAVMVASSLETMAPNRTDTPPTTITAPVTKRLAVVLKEAAATTTRAQPQDLTAPTWVTSWILALTQTWTTPLLLEPSADFCPLWELARAICHDCNALLILTDFMIHF